MGKPAARLGDTTVHGGTITVGYPTVLIGGKPAARVGDMHVCPMVNPGPAPHVGGPVTVGAPTVLIGNMPAARMGDMATCAGPPDTIAMGCPTVLIGGAGGGGGSSQSIRNPNSTNKGDPVDVATGAVFTQETDFTLQGPLSFPFSRSYHTSKSQNSSAFLNVGPGWSCSLDYQLNISKGNAVFSDPSGVWVEFYEIETKIPQTESSTGITISKGHDNGYVVSLVEGINIVFGYINGTKALCISAISDRFGNTINFIYKNGKLIGLKDSAGLIYSFNFNRNGALESVYFNPDNPTLLVRYEYDEKIRLKKVFDRFGLKSEFEYYGNNLMKEVKLRGANSVRYFYNEEARCTLLIQNIDCEYRFQYNLEEKLTIVTDPEGNRFKYWWNNLGVVTKIEDKEGRTTQYLWSPESKLLGVIDGEGRSVCYLYNEKNLLDSVLDEEGGWAKIKYDEKLRIKSLESVLEGKYEIFYDERDLPEKIKTPIGEEYRFKHNEKGQLVEKIEPSGYKTIYEYDVYGNICKIETSTGHSINLKYNKFGELREVSTPNGYSRKFECDKFGHLKSVSDSYGIKVEYERDEWGMILKYQDEIGEISEFFYDQYKNLIRMKDPEGKETHFSYDRLGRIVSIKFSDGRLHKFKYDSVGFLIEHTLPDNAIERYQYDRGYLPILFEKADGTRIKVRYDRKGRPLYVGNKEDAIRYKYDQAGRLIEATRGNHSLRFKYDALGRLVWEKQGNYEVFYSYDSYGYLSSFKTSFGFGAQIKRPNNGAEVFLEIITSRGTKINYNCKDGICWDYLSFGKDVRQYASVDDLGRLKKLSIETPYKKQVFEYLYDNMNALKMVLKNGEEFERFEYNSVGSLIFYQRLNDKPFHKEFSYSLEGTPNLISYPQIKCDKNGNYVEITKGDTRWRYGYSIWNELIWVERNGKRIAEYEYDAFKRRVRRRAEGKEKDYIWHEDLLLAELDIQTGRYIGVGYHPNLACPLWIDFPEGEGLCITNHVGRVDAVVDLQGKERWKAQYDPYGECYEIVSDWKNPLRFPGQWLDAETGLHYNVFRYYDPSLGVYLTPDPYTRFHLEAPYGLILTGGNIYGYASSDPVNLTDYDGRIAPILGLILVGGLIGGIMNVAYNWGKATLRGEKYKTFLKDFTIGGLTGAITAPLGIGIGGFLTRTLGSVMAKAAAKTIANVVANAATGAVGGTVDYLGKVVSDGEPFSWGQLGESVAAGAAMGVITGPINSATAKAMGRACKGGRCVRGFDSLKQLKYFGPKKMSTWLRSTNAKAQMASMAIGSIAANPVKECIAPAEAH